MLRDDKSDGGGRRRSPRNVLGEPLDICSIKPMTGFYRDGCCNTGREDVGSHTICAVMTSAFLEFSKSRGNDLSTPVPEFGFPGLKAGDRWCLCAPRWQEAFEAGQALGVVLRASHAGALAYCSLADLKRFAADLAVRPLPPGRSLLPKWRLGASALQAQRRGGSRRGWQLATTWRRISKRPLSLTESQRRGVCR